MSSSSSSSRGGSGGGRSVLEASGVAILLVVAVCWKLAATVATRQLLPTQKVWDQELKRLESGVETSSRLNAIDGLG